jgi:hypothetical protein
MLRLLFPLLTSQSRTTGVPLGVFGGLCYPTWIFEREWNKPKTLRSHKTTQITTTAFKIDLMLAAIGMKRFTNQSSTPTTIRAKKI